MCGVIGVFGRENAKELVLKGMKLISYRGKDGYGLWGDHFLDYSDSISFKDFNGVNAIGHCLHAVVDKIKQPLSCGGVFAANCEIYNWQELCKEYNLKLWNDAELFFYLLEKFGVVKTLELVDGDYAGVYFRNGKVYLFRDKVGVKPIWYSLENCLVFASERKVLRSFGCENVFELNPRELLVYDVEKKEVEFINLNFYETVKYDDD